MTSQNWTKEKAREWLENDERVLKRGAYSAGNHAQSLEVLRWALDELDKAEAKAHNPGT